MQANWGDATGSFLNMSWIMKILEEVNTTVSSMHTVNHEFDRMYLKGKIVARLQRGFFRAPP